MTRRRSVADGRPIPADPRHATASAASDVTVLIPTCDRPAALAVTLSGLLGQRLRGFGVVIADQSVAPPFETPEASAAIRALRLHGHPVTCLRNLPRRGMAHQREFLLAQAATPYVLFLDDDLLLGPAVLSRMLGAIRRERCGFVGCAPLGLSYGEDERPHEQRLELWAGRVEPEKIRPMGREWGRHMLHNAANLLHVQRSFGGQTEDAYVPYKVAWVGGCVLYDTAALHETGGFGFWRELPPSHAGEDVVAQLRVMERFGGCGLMPSEVYHLELPTTIAERDVDAPHHLIAGT